MTALHDRARKLAEEHRSGSCVCAVFVEGQSPCRSCQGVANCADDMVRLARDFAREAIAYYQRENELRDRGKAEPIDWYLASAVVGVATVEAAIAAAEKKQ